MLRGGLPRLHTAEGAREAAGDEGLRLWAGAGVGLRRGGLGGGKGLRLLALGWRGFAR